MGVRWSARSSSPTPPAADAGDEAATRARAERVLSQARGNSAERFATLAREHGGSASALHGGRRGCLHESEGDEAKELLTALEPIRPGGLSSLIELPGGFHLLRLEQRLSADQLAAAGKLQVARPLAEQAEGERRALAFATRLREAVAGGQAMQTALADLTASALSDAGVAGDLAKAALDSRERPQVEVSASFTRTGILNPIPGALDEAAARQVAFTLSRVGDVFAEPIPTRDGLAVLQLKEFEPATRAQFDEEKADFIRDFRQQVQLDALVTYVEGLRTAANDEIELNARYLEDTEKASDDS
jgi:parvulin-like peptidyl-prolyl isomerase